MTYAFDLLSTISLHKLRDELSAVGAVEQLLVGLRNLLKARIHHGLSLGVGDLSVLDPSRELLSGLAQKLRVVDNDKAWRSAIFTGC